MLATCNEGFHEHVGRSFMNIPEWRWRESNPRPPATQWAFSERSRQRIVRGGTAAGGNVAPYPARCPRRPAGTAARVSPT
jgi:hypothetical protein